ncbi:MAG: LytR cell envelope-related transcriptional attenuator [Pseudonocardiales bacterium]|nr:LytR cell envelope-related transcriptional attenuator [Pseudonocardiales bacterium]
MAATSTRTSSPTTATSPVRTNPATSATTSHGATPTATGGAATNPVTSSGLPDKLPLVVLNNTTVTGLAQRAQASFAAGGWAVTSVGNLRNEIISTCAYYDVATPGAQAAATRLQQQFPAIQRVAPKFAELPSGPIVVVLTPDYTSG